MMRKKISLFVIILMCILVFHTPADAAKKTTVYVISKVDFENDADFDYFSSVSGTRYLSYNKKGLITRYKEWIDWLYYDEYLEDYDDDECTTIYTYKYKKNRIKEIYCTEDREDGFDSWRAKKVVYNKKNQIKKLIFDSGSKPAVFSYNKKNQLVKTSGEYTVKYRYKNKRMIKMVDNYDGSTSVVHFKNTVKNGRLVKYVSSRKMYGTNYKITAKVKYKKLRVSKSQAKIIKAQQEYVKDQFLYDFYGLYGEDTE